MTVACVFALSAHASAQTRRDCRADDALSAAASSLVLSPHDLTPPTIARALRAAGSDLPTAHALRVSTENQDGISAWLAELSRIADAPLVCGEAANDHARVILATPRGGTLEPKPNQERQFQFAVTSTFHDARVMALDAAGVAHSLAILGDAVVVPRELGTPVMVQLVATGSHGPRPVAERALGDWRALGIQGNQTLPLGMRLNAIRDGEGVGLLRANRIMEEVATEHANAVCAAGVAVHTLREGRDPEVRLRAAGVVARVVGETVARAENENAAFDSFNASPSHHAALRDGRFTDVGIASATDPSGHRCVVIMLAAWPRIVPAN